MAEKIFEVERESGEVVLRIRTAAFPIFPDSARSHFWAAHREGLLSLRSFIDAAIEQTEKAEKPKGKVRRKVEVE